MAGIAANQKKFVKSKGLKGIGVKRLGVDDWKDFELTILELVKKWFSSPDNSAKSQKILTEGDHIASYTLYQSLAPEITFDAKGMTLKWEFPEYWRGIDTKMKGEGYSYQLYLDIQSWVQNKPNIQRKIPRKRRKTFAYFVAKKVGEKGVAKNSRFFTGVVDRFIQDVRDKVPKAVVGDLRIMLIDNK